ncbi:MAG: hypothetical protein HFJ64_06335 [Eggerthellaceae bacterium]|nr:hypothetical protein [Eggerthellaceae bacterium]
MRLMSAKQAQAKLMNAAANKGYRSVSLFTFKRDRSVSLHHDENGWVLEEHGFEDSSTLFAKAKPDKRLLKAAFKREFPRSNKIYFSES